MNQLEQKIYDLIVEEALKQAFQGDPVNVERLTYSDVFNYGFEDLWVEICREAAKKVDAVDMKVTHGTNPLRTIVLIELSSGHQVEVTHFWQPTWCDNNITVKQITVSQLVIWNINGRGINRSVSLWDLTRYSQIQSNAEEVYRQSTTNIIPGYYGNLPALREHQIQALEVFMDKGWLADGSGIQFKMNKRTMHWINPFYTVSFDCDVKTDPNSDQSTVLTVKVKPTKMIATVDDETYIVVEFGNLEGSSAAKFITEVERRYGTVFPSTDYGYPV